METKDQLYQQILCDYPETITKEQLYRICGVSKKTALHYLTHGIIPCIDTGKKTRRFTIRTVDVVAFLRLRDTDPHAYVAPIGWYRKKQPSVYRDRNHSPSTQAKLRQALTQILLEYPDVLTIIDVVEVTGFNHETILRWCNKKKVEAFMIRKTFMIPKVCLFEYLTSDRCFAINARAKKHILIKAEQLNK